MARPAFFAKHWLVSFRLERYLTFAAAVTANRFKGLNRFLGAFEE
jgi:hypothetical protein